MAPSASLKVDLHMQSVRALMVVRTEVGAGLQRHGKRADVRYLKMQAEMVICMAEKLLCTTTLLRPYVT